MKTLADSHLKLDQVISGGGGGVGWECVWKLSCDI